MCRPRSPPAPCPAESGDRRRVSTDLLTSLPREAIGWDEGLPGLLSEPPAPSAPGAPVVPRPVCGPAGSRAHLEVDEPRLALEGATSELTPGHHLPVGRSAAQLLHGAGQDVLVHLRPPHGLPVRVLLGHLRFQETAADTRGPARAERGALPAAEGSSVAAEVGGAEPGLEQPSRDRPHRPAGRSGSPAMARPAVPSSERKDRWEV